MKIPTTNHYKNLDPKVLKQVNSFCNLGSGKSKKNYPLKVKWANDICKCVNGYSKPINPSFGNNIKWIAYRVFNAVKSIFGHSDWDIAVAAILERKNSYGGITGAAITGATLLTAMQGDEEKLEHDLIGFAEEVLKSLVERNETE